MTTVCRHLSPLTTLLRRRGGRVVGRHRNLVEGGVDGLSLYFDLPLPPSVGNEAGLDASIRYERFGVVGQYAGFFCDRCACRVAGADPAYDPNHPPIINGPFS